MDVKDKIIDLIYQVVDEFNQQEDQYAELEKSLTTIILGKESILDSLGIVNFIVAVEQNIEDTFDLSITLADERALSQTESPFSTIQSLTNYIEMLIDESPNE